MIPAVVFQVTIERQIKAHHEIVSYSANAPIERVWVSVWCDKTGQWRNVYGAYLSGSASISLPYSNSYALRTRVEFAGQWTPTVTFSTGPLRKDET